MNKKKLEKDLEELYHALLNKEFLARQIADEVHPENRKSALNLVRYITLRSQDIRKVHDHLSELGISSLRSSEGYVYRNITDALKLVKLINGSSWTPFKGIACLGYKKSKKLLRRRTNRLFNFNKRTHATEIMVTMPTSAATDKKWLSSLIDEGMEMARINLSHDNPETWELIAANINAACDAVDKPCKIYIDLSGPKIRTGKINITKKRKKGGNKNSNFIRLHTGDHLVLTKVKNVSNPVRYGKKGEILKPATISISIPSVIDDIKIDDRVFFDDGKIEAKVIAKNSHKVKLVIEQTRENGVKLKSEKGINLPDTLLNLPSLTDKDIANLPFVSTHADIVGYSFVRTPEDVRRLYEELDKYDRDDLGIVLKIETNDAFENLPLILLEAMKKPKVGVMIARGDLAVEIGPERIAEVQDEILWICEAAHIPVIWATQVLESLAKTGLATRAEITDAAKSARAECVMLNKGPYILNAVSLLSKILKRMEDHTNKKKNTMRALHVASANIDKMNKVPKHKIVSSKTREPFPDPESEELVTV